MLVVRMQYLHFVLFLSREDDPLPTVDSFLKSTTLLEARECPLITYNGALK